MRDLFSPRQQRALLAASLLGLLTLRLRSAEDSLSLKHQSYQEADGRIRVDSQYAYAEAQLPKEVRLQLTGVIDTVTGATPTGELKIGAADPVVLAQMHDRRKAWHAELSRQFPDLLVSVGYDNSRENDYVSNAGSLNIAKDINAKNTTLLAGLAYADDDVKSVGTGVWRGKRTTDALIGVTQLINPETTLNVSLTYGHGSGSMNDTYKLVQKSIEVLPGLFQTLTFGENRPDSRTRRIASATLNHAMPKLSGAFEAGYRLYDDSYGITSHTLSLQWFQRVLSDRVILTPSVRYHRQSAASFYYPNLDLTSIVPETDPSVHYTSDYRLAELETWNVGFKVVWFVVPDRFSVDVSYDHYRMKGLDGLTSASAFPKANIYTAGLRLAW